MTPERYRRVVEVFEQVCDCAPESREQLLARLCRGEDELRVEIEAMLTADEQSRNFLETPPGDVAAGMLATKQSRPLIGETVCEYQVIARLGSGGMGEVFLAQDTRLGRRAALKFLSEEFSVDPTRLRRFEQEARTVSALSHPNIVTIYGLGQAGPINFIATEFVDGRTLRDEIANGPLAPYIAVEIALQATSALKAAHATGIVHRDIKPENIIVRVDGLIKVLDFGLAKRTESLLGSRSVTASGESNTIPGLVVGTPRYMSPEQARGLPVDARTDLFSLGSVLYEMLVGSPAVTGSNPTDILAALLTRDPVPLEKLRPDCPAALVRIVNRALERDRDRRYQSAEEMFEDLTSARHGQTAFGTRTGLTGIKRDLPSWPVGDSERNLVEQPSVEPSHKWIHRRVATWIVVAAASSMGLLFTPFIRHWSQLPQYYSAVPLTANVGVAMWPSFSPDGERVAFAWNGEKQDNFDIYVKQIGVEAAIRLTTDSRADLSPAWSPDGRFIAFVRVLSTLKAEVLLISSLGGGPARRLREIAAPIEAISRLRLLAWSPHGNSLVVSDGLPGDSLRSLFLLSIETGEERRLTVPPPSYDDVDPSLSPDMHRLVFARHAGASTGDLYLLTLSRDLHPQGEPKRLTSYNRLTSSPVWTPDGRAIVFARAEQAGMHALWRMRDANPSKIEPLPISVENSAMLAISPQGSRLIYTREKGNSKISGVEITRFAGARDQQYAPRPWMASSADEGTPQFSPDGLQIAFQSTRSGYDEIWVTNRDGSNARQLTNIRAGIEGFPHWSPDGKKIVFHSRQSIDATLFIVDAAGGRPQRLTDEPGDDFTPSWSRDGQWIYFGSRRTGETHVWKISARGGPATQITRHRGSRPVESPDRRYLFYTNPDDSAVWRLRLPEGPEEKILPDVAGWGTAFDVTSRGIYFIGPEISGAGQRLAFFSFGTGHITSLAAVPGEINYGLAASPDELLVLYAHRENVGSDLMLVENFR